MPIRLVRFRSGQVRSNPYRKEKGSPRHPAAPGPSAEGAFRSSMSLAGFSNFADVHATMKRNKGKDVVRIPKTAKPMEVRAFHNLKNWVTSSRLDDSHSGAALSEGPPLPLDDGKRSQPRDVPAPSCHLSLQFESLYGLCLVRHHDIRHSRIEKRTERRHRSHQARCYCR
jgi:hypothetical protein